MAIISSQDEYEAWLTGWNEERWHIVFHDYPAQSEYTVHTNLRIGSAREAYVEFQGRTRRWINPQPDRSAVLVIPADTRDAYQKEDYKLAQAFLNHSTFETDRRASIVGMSSYMRRIAPLLMPSRELPVVWSEEKLSSEAAELSTNLDFALVLYREGMNSFSTSPFLAFLSFYKVLELAIMPLLKNKDAGRADLARWINENAESQTAPHFFSTSITSQSASKHNNLGDYFYVQCRCVVAHTQSDPVANPNLSEDYQRISNDTYVMRDLARFAIGSKLGILSHI